MTRRRRRGATSKSLRLGTKSASSRAQRFDWTKVFRLASLVYGKRSEKWVLAVNGSVDPRRYRSWKDMDESLRVDLRLDWIPEDASIRGFRAVTSDTVTPKPTWWQCFKWAWKREARIWRLQKQKQAR